jgi:hypothetical protein
VIPDGWHSNLFRGAIQGRLLLKFSNINDPKLFPEISFGRLEKFIIRWIKRFQNCHFHKVSLYRYDSPYRSALFKKYEELPVRYYLVFEYENGDSNPCEDFITGSGYYSTTFDTSTTLINEDLKRVYKDVHSTPTDLYKYWTIHPLPVGSILPKGVLRDEGSWILYDRRKSEKRSTYKSHHKELVKKILLQLRTKKKKDPTAQEVWSELLQRYEKDENDAIEGECKYEGLIETYDKTTRSITFRHPKTKKPCASTKWGTFQNWVSEIKRKSPYSAK